MNSAISFYVFGGFLKLTSIHLAVINLNIQMASGETAQMLRLAAASVLGWLSVICFSYVVKQLHILSSCRKEPEGSQSILICFITSQ